MTDTSRRNFLMGMGAAAGLAMFPPVIRDALAVAANNTTKSLQDVDHIVVLMQENRSFDHYFGTMAGVRGFGDRFPIPLPGGRNVFQQSNGMRTITPYYLDQSRGNAQRVSGTPHSWGDAQAAWDNGRMAEWPRHKQDQSMGYYRQPELAFQYALANAFTLCDAYHCASQTGTNTNRLFHWTGTNGPTGAGVAVVTNEWDSLDSQANGFTWTTYPERLQQAGVTWKVYQNLPDNFTDNPLAGFRQFRKANEDVGNLPSGFPYIPYTKVLESRHPLYKGIGNTMPLGGLLLEFKADVKAGRLPQVSWLVAPSNYSEHPGPSSPIQGAWYIQETLAALVAVPEVWARTALIVNFDENDGFFDHVPPPALFSINPDGTPAGASTLKDVASERFTHPNPPGTTGQPQPDGRVYGPGPRVPCYVVSPWSRGGWVNSEVFDHTSVLRFIEKRFGVAEPNISPYRRAVCGDLTSAFDFVNPNAVAPTMPKRSRISADALRVSQDLKEQVPLPTEEQQSVPRQDGGLRRSRALPYELHVDAVVDGQGVRLRFRNTGTVGAVFHVYDRLHLDRLPRRYMAEAAKQIAGDWVVAADDGRYDLWVLGPNGFHRHFTGDVTVAGGGKLPNPEISLSYDRANQRLNIVIANNGDRACNVRLEANAYEGLSVVRKLARGAEVVERRSVKAQGNWYDYTVTLDNDPGFSRRFAGRMETGADSTSDPAITLLTEG